MEWYHYALIAYSLTVGMIWGNVIAEYGNRKYPKHKAVAAIIVGAFWPILLSLGWVLVKVGYWPDPEGTK